MSDRYQANIITKNPTDPAGQLETDAAPGVWSLDEALTYKKAGIWPTAGLVENDVTDVFSTYVYAGTGSSRIIDNGVKLGQSYGSGGIFYPDGDGDYLATASLPEFTGAFTFELWFFSYDTDRALYLIDKSDRNTNFSITTNYLTTFDQIFVRVAGTTQNPSSVGFDPDGWNHVAVVRDSSDNLSTFVNGTRVANNSSVSGSITAAPYYIGGNSTGTSASGYEPMYGYMSSVRISDTARYSTSSTSITVPTTNFTSDSNTVLLIGQGDTPLVDASSNSYSVTVNGTLKASTVGRYDAATAGDGGMVWIKNRSSTDNHILFDTQRGVNNYIKSNSADGEASVTSVSSFNTSGFSIDGGGGYINQSANDYVAWTFRKTPKFFDIQEWSGDEVVGRQISHNLGVAPGWILVKRTSATRQWAVYHRSQGATKYGIFNSTDAFATSSAHWNDTEPTDTHFTVGDAGDTNTAGYDYVAYLFAHNDGDGDFGPSLDSDIIKCGSYTGNGSANGPEIDLGFEPQWLLIKNATESGSSSTNWIILDNMRGLTVNGGNDPFLRPNLSNAEASAFDCVDPSAKGFKVVSTSAAFNTNGQTFIYIAIRRGPLAVPTDATNVFAPNFGDTGNAEGYLGHVADWALKANRLVGTYNFESFQRLTKSSLLTSSTAAEVTISDNRWDNMIGYRERSQAQDTEVIMYTFARAPHFFDTVCYTGDGSGTRTVNHNLGVAPDMLWLKRRDGSSPYGDWYVQSTGISATNYLRLNSTAAQTGSPDAWSSTYAASDVFTVGPDNNVSGFDYIVYLFASLDGVSKVGTYTGTGATLNIDCGFTAGARMVLIKRIDSSSPWWIWDTVRGITSGNDPWLELNNASPETTGYDWLDPYNSGFSVPSSGNNNTSGGTYIFYAIA